MSKAKEIQSIIAQRQPLADKLEDIESRLKSLYNSLQELERGRQQQLKNWSDNSTTQSKLKTLNFTNIGPKVLDGLESLRRLQGRFSRNTLNIGVIGHMGQGKSTLLQSLSGLRNEVIPALPGKACTAARSTICHQEGNGILAEIQFHDKNSFLIEVIIPYYEKLGLNSRPSSFDEFAQTELPSLPSKDQTKINIYHRLEEDYHTNARKYQDFLGRGSLNIQDQSQISNYVSQKYNQDDQLINHQCLAVKHVKISCPFPVNEMGAIALVDVPGLGDFRLGDESLVIEALGQEVDFILFIYKPSKDRGNFKQSDTDLYDLAKKALNDLPKRSIFVLNVDKNGENKGNCESLKRDIDSGKVEMPVLSCVIADCSSPDEANSKVLQAVLDNLRSNVTELDRSFTREKIEDIEKSLSELHQQLQLAQDALPKIDGEIIKEKKYDDLFKEFWEKITNEMTELQERLIQNRDLPDENLKTQIETVFQVCRQKIEIPKVEEVKRRIRTLGYSETAYSEYLGKLRTKLSSQFLDIDTGLKKSIEQVKTEVANVLIENCSLGGLSELRGVDFLSEIYSQISSEYTELKKGFEILSEFNLSYRGLIQHRIRLQLDRLTPDKTARLPVKAGGNANDVEANAKDVIETLEEL
ncbi:dynamin family protein [Limnoraphis robusta Tam1]|nr:dynamin family protein [Limnoraphis robusta]MEA5537837.1 dynamin family protein [Limnoraphis robusta Tam1]